MNIYQMATNPLLHAGQLFSIKRPMATHWRPAACAEVRCPHHLNGWRTEIDERSGLGQGQAAYIRRNSGRKFVEEKQETGLTRFTFEAGQRCFGEHKLPSGLDPLFIRQRVRSGMIASTQRAEWPEWMDTFNTEMERAAKGR